MSLRRIIPVLILAGFQILLWNGSSVHAQAPMTPPAPGEEPQVPEPTPLPHPDLPPPELPTTNPDYTWLWILGTCLSMAILVLGWALLRSHATSPPPLPKARRDALQALRKLRAQADVTPPRDTASGVSAIVRNYLLIAYEVPAPRRTSRELFHLLDSPKQIRSLAPLGDLWDRLSYGPPVDSPAEALTLIDKAIAHLEAEPEHPSPVPPSAA